ncbi:hypothetical protein [Lacinutrix sp. Hel_I_90]|uniref:hypothetical protein n=1 Tax=Lacinutrix sp. Hel_I_90 TaxID=1249999 RepID=UPI000A9844F6|nr:hypothetical protein [Lacinutrix sp. Hel_I_90]
MKTLTLLIALVSVSFFSTSNMELTPSELENNATVLLTFDAFEGGHYFFTDINNEAMSFDDIMGDTSIKTALENGDYIGTSFNVSYIKINPHNFNNIIKKIELYSNANMRR